MNNPIEILQKYWKHTKFRQPQEEIISATLQKQNTIVLLPTGSGKSLCYQIPTLLQKGICIVISPLIALINDQVNQLKEKNIKAIALTSQINFEATITAFDNLQFGNYKFLYLSPEKLQNPLIQEKITQLNVSLIAIDEAHCISEWGHDFRPSYLKLNILQELCPQANIMALTATATPKVLLDIKDKLTLKNAVIFKKSFKRNNIKYKVTVTENIYDELLYLVKKIKGSIIVYAGTRKQTKEIAVFLFKNGFKSNFYHGGLSTSEKSLAYENWTSNKIPIMVATTAFGMGINKRDVRAVIHITLPNSIENYLQESGRAGRDNQHADAIIISNKSMTNNAMHQFITNTPKPLFVKEVYQKLNQYFNISIGEIPNEIFNFSIQEFCYHYNLPLLKTFNSLNILSREGVIYIDENFRKKSTVKFLIRSEQIFEYLKNNPNKKVLINLLLRSYGGIYDYNTIINEYILSKKTNTSTQQIIKQLKELHTDKIIHYKPNNNQSEITFLLPRDDNYIINKISKQIKQQYLIKLNKLENIIQYIFNTETCRNIQISNYFQESLNTPCGNCDICIKTINNTIHEDLLSEQVLNLIKTETLTSAEICQKISVEKNNILKCLKYLLNEDKIYINSQNKFKAF
jgi:ATP-dependent DNA helicase RecQ